MRLVGMCERCHRFRRVRPTTRILAAGMVTGICQQCEDAERQAREERER